MDTIERINALTQKQRDDAIYEARLKIAGDKPVAGIEPQFEHYLKTAQSRYPVWFSRAVSVSGIAMLIVAFLPSAMRLHAVGMAAFAQSIAHATSVYFAALCIVLMAETGLLVFTIAAATATERINKIALYIGAGVCAVIALSGNAVAVGSHALDNVFTFVETFAPPLLTLLTAQVLKSQALHAIEDRHEAKTQFQAAHANWKTSHENAAAGWQQQFDNAHETSEWMKALANALRDAIMNANRRSPAAIRALSLRDWYALIGRELRTENWYTYAEEELRLLEAQERLETQMDEDDEPDTDEEATQEVQPTKVIAAKSSKSHGTHTRELDNAVITNADGTHTATCPHCQRAFRNAKPRGAINALVAHARRCEMRKSAMENDTEPVTPVRVESED